ncbi:RagB/SusD family nutrient uptake outer membrane protein [Niabella ginsengisoli]|uniref:RagB/SusD family nutrient uptake outer membrane protein n=1 Tax=Niabella ginsengisoli TaxID=522298 RepID=UPI0021D46E27|nr:RagB/SusD family nutrient uptake outer membrane protein [Niabella ginsengisoli]
MRLADLYLLYSEALNESQGPGPEVYAYVDSVRARSGLKGVQEAWANFSLQPSKPLTKEGMRNIIKRERTIELAFEGKRFWDLRRWKDARAELNELILGWDIGQRDPAPFYRPITLYNRTFTERDYFWPISIEELTRNRELKQNLGW